MKLSFLFSFLLLGLWVPATLAGYVCTQKNVTQTALARQADFLFLIDASGSMGPYIEGVKAGLNRFAQLVATSKVQAQFAVVQFGGTPAILLPFTNQTTTLYDVVNAISTTAGGQEASFEAIRRSLPPFNGEAMNRRCPKSLGGSSATLCRLNWRANATKVIILLTDEDSDIPTNTTFRVSGQTASTTFCQGGYTSKGACSQSSYWEPSFQPAILNRVPTTKSTYNYYRNGTNLRIHPAFQLEINVTADTLLRHGVFLNSMVSKKAAGTDLWAEVLPVSAFNSKSYYWRSLKVDTQDNATTALMQFGDPFLQAQNGDYAGFRANETLKSLLGQGYGGSLQAQMLQRGGFNRVFDIENFVSGVNMNIINAFYDQLVETTVFLQEQCVFVPDPETSSTTSWTSTTTSSSSSSSWSTTILATTSATTMQTTTSELSVSTPMVSTTMPTDSSTTEVQTTSNELSSTLTSSRMEVLTTPIWTTMTSSMLVSSATTTSSVLVTSTTISEVSSSNVLPTSISAVPTSTVTSSDGALITSISSTSTSTMTSVLTSSSVMDVASTSSDLLVTSTAASSTAQTSLWTSDVVTSAEETSSTSPIEVAITTLDITSSPIEVATTTLDITSPSSTMVWTSTETEVATVISVASVSSESSSSYSSATTSAIAVASSETSSQIATSAPVLTSSTTEAVVETPSLSSSASSTQESTSTTQEMLTTIFSETYTATSSSASVTTSETSTTSSSESSSMTPAVPIPTTVEATTTTTPTATATTSSRIPRPTKIVNGNEINEENPNMDVPERADGTLDFSAIIIIDDGVSVDVPQGNSDLYQPPAETIVVAVPTTPITEQSQTGSSTFTAVVAAGSVGAVAVGAGALGVLLFRRRQRNLQAFRDMSTTTDQLNGANPLYAGEKYIDNPLFQAPTVMGSHASMSDLGNIRTARDNAV